MLLLKRLSSRLIEFTLCLALTIFLLSGCNIEKRLYPYQIAERWVCDEPEFILEYEKDGKGSSCERIVQNGKTIFVEIGYISNRFDIYRYGEWSNDNRIMSGTWKHCGESLVFYIDEDFIFDGKYSYIIFDNKSHLLSSRCCGTSGQ